ncbi:hypothetical protein Ndes2526B_g07894 [Nannochloris sp. 'desiccata']
MGQLGFPQDVIDVFKSLYTDASTILVTPLGRSTAIPQDSGAVQGDTPSPLLFNIAIEPLLQWLHQNQGPVKKGYEFESHKKYSKISHVPDHHRHLPATGYADDLHLIDSCVNNMQQQINKIELYSEWLGIFLSPPKM